MFTILSILELILDREKLLWITNTKELNRLIRKNYSQFNWL